MEGVKEMIERQMSEFSKLRDEFQEIADSMRTELGSLKVKSGTWKSIQTARMRS